MDNLVPFVFPLEVRDLEGLHRRQRPIERLARSPVGVTQLLPDSPERAKHASPIEALPFAMFAVAHTPTLSDLGRGFTCYVPTCVQSSPTGVRW